MENNRYREEEQELVQEETVVEKPTEPLPHLGLAR